MDYNNLVEALDRDDVEMFRSYIDESNVAGLRIPINYKEMGGDYYREGKIVPNHAEKLSKRFDILRYRYNERFTSENPLPEELAEFAKPEDDFFLNQKKSIQSKSYLSEVAKRLQNLFSSHARVNKGLVSRTFPVLVAAELMHSKNIIGFLLNQDDVQTMLNDSIFSEHSTSTQVYNDPSCHGSRRAEFALRPRQGSFGALLIACLMNDVELGNRLLIAGADAKTSVVTSWVKGYNAYSSPYSIGSLYFDRWADVNTLVQIPLLHGNYNLTKLLLGNGAYIVPDMLKAEEELGKEVSDLVTSFSHQMHPAEVQKMQDDERRALYNARVNQAKEAQEKSWNDFLKNGGEKTELFSLIENINNKEEVLILSDTEAIVSSADSDIHSHSGCSYFAVLNVISNGKIKSERWKWRDGASAKNDDSSLTIHGFVLDKKETTANGKIVYSIRIYNHERWKSNGRIVEFTFDASTCATKGKLSKAEQTAFKKQFEEFKEKIFNEAKEHHARQVPITLAGQGASAHTMYVQHDSPILFDDRYLEKYGVGVFATQLHVDSRGWDKQYRKALYVFNCGKEEILFQECSGYGREGGLELHVIFLSPETLSYTVRGSEQNYAF